MISMFRPAPGGKKFAFASTVWAKRSYGPVGTAGMFMLRMTLPLSVKPKLLPLPKDREIHLALKKALAGMRPGRSTVKL
ncbi:hypothetical protein D3C87_2089820 [compost metagenome]